MISKVELRGLKLLWARKYVVLLMLGCYGDRFFVGLFNVCCVFDLPVLLHSLDAALLRFLPLQGLVVVLWHPISGCTGGLGEDGP